MFQSPPIHIYKYMCTYLIRYPFFGTPNHHHIQYIDVSLANKQYGAAQRWTNMEMWQGRSVRKAVCRIVPLSPERSVSTLWTRSCTCPESRLWYPPSQPHENGTYPDRIACDTSRSFWKNRNLQKRSRDKYLELLKGQVISWNALSRALNATDSRFPSRWATGRIVINGVITPGLING